MADRQLQVLGNLEISVDGVQYHALPLNKASALLAFLALESKTAHSRAGLIAIFWPDYPKENAQANLRTTLMRLRAQLAAISPGMPNDCLEITRQHVRCKTAAFNVDALAMERLIVDVSVHRHDALEDCETCLAKLAAAADLYRGELLAGLDISEADPFEEWLLLRREALRYRVAVVLEQLVRAHTARQDYETAHHYAMRAVTLDPLREQSHRDVMLLRARLGLPAEALNHYALMRAILAEEIGVAPTTETEALRHAIEEGEFGPQRDGRTVAPAHEAAIPPRTVEGAIHLVEGVVEFPDVDAMVGRAEEIATLVHSLTQEAGGLVGIFGIGGVGKTTLAAHVARLVAPDFDVVIWRSLVNAPPLDELLPSVLQTLSGQRLSAIPTDVDSQLHALLTYVRVHRVLLVLDNMESIFATEPAGALRHEYEPYGQLLHAMAYGRVAGALLFTSRVRPHGFARWQRNTHRVRSVRLTGLSDAEGRQLLSQHAMRAQPDAMAEVVQRYSGNPLALKLIATTVDELFQGNVSAFLQDTTPVFDDIRSVLDAQFGRLPAQEQELLYWLALMREPQPALHLHRMLLHPTSGAMLLETLRGLQRRSLIENQPHGFGLQNVVIEYLSERVINEFHAELESGQLALMHRLAALNAQAKVFVRETQTRLVLAPIVARVAARHGDTQIAPLLRNRLAALRQTYGNTPSYAAGNLLNLLLHTDGSLQDEDFSQLNIRQAYLQGITLHNVDFRGAHFVSCRFTSYFGRVKSMAISPDGARLALGTDDGEVRLWSIADGELERMLPGFGGLVVSVTFCPAGRHLAGSSSLEGAIYLWDVTTGDVIGVLHGHRGGVEVVRFSPDGTLLASGGHDGTLRLWDVDAQTQIASWPLYADWVTALDFHPQGHALAVAGFEGNRCVIVALDRLMQGDSAADEDAIVLTQPGAATRINALAFSPSGTRLAVGGTLSDILLWDLETRQIALTLTGHMGPIRALQYGQDGQLLVSASEDFTVRRWDTASGQLLSTLRRHSNQLVAIGLSRDGTTLASGGSDGIVHLWDLRQTGTENAFRTIHGYVAPIYTLVVDPQGTAFATGEGGGCVRLWTLRMPSGAATPTHVLHGHTELIDTLSYSASGRWLVSGCKDKTIRVWDTESRRCIDTWHLSTPAGIHTVFHPDEVHLACSFDNMIYLRRLDATGHGDIVGVFAGHAENIRQIAFSPDGRYLASCGLDNTVRLWDVATGTCIQVFDDNIHSFWSVAFSPSGQHLAGGGRTGIRVWNLSERGRPLMSYRSWADATNIRPVAFNQAGTQLVSGGIDRTVRVWDLVHDRELLCLRGHTADVTSAAFLPGDARLVSCSYDGTVRVWDVATGASTYVLRLPGPYTGMRIGGATGITAAREVELRSLGAVD